MPRMTEEEKKKEKPVSRAQMEREVTAVRKQVHDILEKAHARSEKSGKPLLIMVGENHGSANSVLLESIIYQEARALGIKDLAIEMPSRGKEGEEAKKTLESAPLIRSEPGNMSSIFHQGEHFGHTIHFVDGRHKAGEKALFKGAALEYRNETMAANLALIKEQTLLCCGADHLKGLDNLMKRHNTHELVCFDVSPSKINSSLQKPKKESHLKIGHQLNLSFEANRLLTDELFCLGMGKEEGGEFLHWAEEKDLKPTKQELLNNLTSLKKRADGRGHTNDLLAYSDALYELGRDKEAGIYFSKFIKRVIDKKYQNELHDIRPVSLASTFLDFTHTDAFNEGARSAQRTQKHDHKDVAKTDFHPSMATPQVAATPPIPKIPADLLKSFQSPHAGSLPVEDPAHSPQRIHLPTHGIKIQQDAAPVRQANPGPKGWSL